jgi:hypothetical protein
LEAIGLVTYGKMCSQLVCMNVELIYRNQRDDAFANQFEAESYRTFVAMPFSNRGGYPEPRIRQMLLEQVHVRANELLEASPIDSSTRRFEPLYRADGTGAAGAVSITDEIVSEILDSHFFVGDLTGNNFGVVLETGLALALKPNLRNLVVTQDPLDSLHFDLHVTRVSRYTEENLVEIVANALASAARAFEAESDLYVRHVSSQLSPNAILLLNSFGRMAIQADPQIMSWFYLNVAAGHFPEVFGASHGPTLFQLAVDELLDRRLFWTDYRAAYLDESGDVFRLHATALGWLVIEHIWSHNDTMRRPGNALIRPQPYRRPRPAPNPMLQLYREYFPDD